MLMLGLNELIPAFYFVNFQIFMSAVWNGGKLGVAYYNLDTTLMYMMLDTEETDDFQLLRRGILFSGCF
jgi:hypothetical protein